MEQRAKPLSGSLASSSELVPRAPPRRIQSPQVQRKRMDLISCESIEDGNWRLTLDTGEERQSVVRSEEALRDLGRELGTTLNLSSAVGLTMQLRGLSQHPACVALFSSTTGDAERKRKAAAPWYVDCRVVEGRNLALLGGEKVYIALCLESQPTVRFVTAPKQNETDPVWNSDASFVCDDVRSERLHVTLITKRNVVVGKFAVPLDLLVDEGAEASGGMRSFWFNFRDVYDAVCIERDVPTDPESEIPHGYVSFGLLHLQLEASRHAAQMSLSKAGTPLRWLPYRIQPGDVLFFSSRKLVTTGTKLATRSRWDHVALVISYKAYRKLYILQSTTSGVEVTDAESALKGYWSASHSIGVRRLLRPADARFVQGLSDFAERNVGKPYNYNFISRPKKDPSTAQAAADKLFCSELVAAAFLSVGVLPNTASASSFLPATFASAKVQTNSGWQLLPLVKLPVAGPKSEDVVWAREETHLRNAYLLAVTGRPFEPASRQAVKLLRGARELMTLQALYPHAASDRSELALNEGDVVLLLEKDPSAWWMGQHQITGRIGVFPANHVEVLQPRKKMSAARVKQSSRKRLGGSDAAADESSSAAPSTAASGANSGAATPPVGISECTFCHQPVWAGDETVAIGSSVVLHERCVSAFVSQQQDRSETMCFLCGMVSHLTMSKCAVCARNVCALDGNGVSDGTGGGGSTGAASASSSGGAGGVGARLDTPERVCRVCAWAGGAQPHASNSSDGKNRSAEVWVALQSHARGAPNELSFVKGDLIELRERFDWGWCVGVTADGAVGLFPANVCALAERKWSLRNLRSQRIKSPSTPGRTSGSKMFAPVMSDGAKRTVSTSPEPLSPPSFASSAPSSPNLTRSPSQSLEQQQQRLRPLSPQLTKELAALAALRNDVQPAEADTSPPGPSPPARPQLLLPPLVLPVSKTPRGPAPELPERPDLTRRMSVYEMLTPPDTPPTAGRFFAITLGSDSDSEEDSVESADAIADSAEDEEEASSRDESPPPHRVVALPP